jgi:hypothetical protein
MSLSSCPLTITVGGIRVLPSLDSDRKLSASPVLNVAVAIDARVCSPVERCRFCAKLQSYLNNPQSQSQSLLKDDNGISSASNNSNGGKVVI